jgi:hypothetical protein
MVSNIGAWDEIKLFSYGKCIQEAFIALCGVEICT